MEAAGRDKAPDRAGQQVPAGRRLFGHLSGRQKVLGVPRRWHSLPGKPLANLELKHNTERVENIHLFQALRVFLALPPAPHSIPAPKDGEDVTHTAPAPFLLCRSYAGTQHVTDLVFLSPAVVSPRSPTRSEGRVSSAQRAQSPPQPCGRGRCFPRAAGARGATGHPHTAQTPSPPGSPAQSQGSSSPSPQQ